MDCFSIDAILRLLAAAKAWREDAWLLILVSYIHALRSSEAVGLTPENVIGDYLVVPRKKGSRPVRDELHLDENELLNERPALIDLAGRTGRNQRIFPIRERTFQRWMHRCGKAAGLPELLSHPHTLKHSILTQMTESGAHIHEVQAHGGHKSLSSTGIYLHPKPEKVAAALRKALSSQGSLAD